MLSSHSRLIVSRDDNKMIEYIEISSKYDFPGLVLGTLRSMCQRMNQKVFSRDRSCSIFFTPLVFPSHGQFSFLIGFSSHTWWSPHFHSVSIRFLDRPRFTAVLQNNARVSFNTKKYINRSRAISFLFFLIYIF